MRNRQPLKESTKQKIRESMIRIGHKPPSRKGSVMSKSSILKMSLSKKGFKHSEETRHKMSVNRSGANNHFFGKQHNENTIRRMSLAKIALYKSGRKPANYITDRSKLAKRQMRNDSAYIEWRKKVRNRDNWKCQLTDDNCEGKVVAHHIKSWRKYPSLRYEIKNGITLCRFHHPRKRDDEVKLEPLFNSLVLTKG